MDYDYFGSSWIAAQQLGLETESSANRISAVKIFVLVLFWVIHTGSPLVLYSIISYLVHGIDRCRDTFAAVRGGFQPESPN